MVKIELTKERLIIIIGSVLAIVVLGIYMILYKPLIKELKAQYLECKTIEIEVLEARNIIASAKITEIKSSILTEKDIPLAINELTKYANLKGINFVSITPKAVKKEAQYNILPIELKLESTYKELGVFLGSLGELKKSLVTAKDFNIIPYEKDPTQLKTKLMVNMYLLGQKNAE